MNIPSPPVPSAPFCGPWLRAVGLVLLLAVSLWALWRQLPVFQEGYLNAGDDHIHVAYANELVRIWREEGNLLGWSRLYGPGAPIFLLRPPGFYMAVALVHLATGLTVEEALKTLVVLGLSLYPLAVHVGARMLGLGFSASLGAGLLALLPVSLWGHSFDAYHYLGIHKQLLAILFFPVALGALWQVLTRGRFALLLALLFAAMFLTHPYIAYCFVLLIPAMLISLPVEQSPLFWRQSLPLAAAGAVVAALLIGIWLVPFLSSPESQAVDPFQGRRSYFDVTGCTVAETLRSYFLGSLFDTARYAGPFGGVKWEGGNEWGWLDNGSFFRVPVITGLSLVGLGMVLRRRAGGNRGFVALAFLGALALLMGPDDFPFLDRIPNARQFQNIHAAFLTDWAAVVLAGIGLDGLVSFFVTFIRKKWGPPHTFSLSAAGDSWTVAATAPTEPSPQSSSSGRGRKQDEPSRAGTSLRAADLAHNVPSPLAGEGQGEGKGATTLGRSFSRWRPLMAGVSLLAVILAIGTGFYERTQTGKNLIDIRNIKTENGALSRSGDLFPPWLAFRPIATILKSSSLPGGIAAYPQGHEDAVLYNLLPLMVDRPVFLSGFEELGGLYSLLLQKFRGPLRDNYYIQRLLDIRYVVNSPRYRKEPLVLHDQARWLHRTDDWELAVIDGDFSAIEALPQDLLGFIGKEEEWSRVMERWLQLVAAGKIVPWVVDLTYSLNDKSELERLAPLVKKVIIGRPDGGRVAGVRDGAGATGQFHCAVLPAILADRIQLAMPGGREMVPESLLLPEDNPASEQSAATMAKPLPCKVIEQSRRLESFQISGGSHPQALVFKKAFYRGWKAWVDGVITPLHRLSPGLQLLLLPPGDHRVEWHYSGPNQWGWARLSFLAGILGAVGLAFLSRRLRLDGSNMPDGGAGGHQARLCRFLPFLLSLGLICIFIWQAGAEAYYKKIVAIAPRSDEVFPGGSGDFFWNDLVGVPANSQHFVLQIARDPLFHDLMGEKAVRENHIHIPDLFRDKGPYYFRVRLAGLKEASAWSKPVRFYAHGEE